MFWALAEGSRRPPWARVRAGARRHPDAQPVGAEPARLEVTALSLAAYPFVQEDYALLPHGASIGSGYGPIVVAREPMTLDELRDVEIVVPGHADHLVPRASSRARRLPPSRGAIRGDPGRDRFGAGHGGAAHPRGSADLRELRAREDPRSRRVVAARDRAAASARRERRAARPRREGPARRVRGSRARRSSARSTIAPRRSSTRCSSGAASTRPSPTGSCRCT